MLSLKKLNLKHFHSFFFAPKQAFTLVELIVVISVLGVLATIAFTQVSNVTLSARNSTRMTNLQSISSALNIYAATNGVYPIPDNKTDILYSGTTIWYQWYIKDTAARLLKLSPTASQDPLNTSTYFSYATNASRTNMQLLGFLEANTTSFKALPATFASDELSTKTPHSVGEELGILYTSGTTTPLSGTSIELNTTTNPYTAYYNSTDSISWTGNLLQNLVISYAHGSGFGSPSTSDCPTGFIPVPGNKDFNQPGFCVAKYEMKQAVGDAGTYAYIASVWTPSGNQVSPYCTNTSSCNSTGSRNFTNAIVSKADGSPITFLNQYNAIEACNAMGAGYHVLTNNEWMTMARDIENTAINWSSGSLGNGYIYNGHIFENPDVILSASPNDADGFFGITGFTGDGSQYNNKRTLAFSNGQVIWDLSWNAWEHTIKSNNISGLWYSSATQWVSNVCGGSAWYSFAGNDGYAECGYVNGYTKENIAPKTAGMNALNGMGRIRSYSTAENITVRGGAWRLGATAGLYALRADPSNVLTDAGIGFRCAK